MLKALGRDEIDGIVAERGGSRSAATSAASKYHFDAVDVGELFTPARDQPPSPGGVH